MASRKPPMRGEKREPKREERMEARMPMKQRQMAERHEAMHQFPPRRAGRGR